ncbi:helix-turn-helix domain-containing protein [Amycolatopsis magusensis]|uniref:helix-turn-helix domain-containing protein n=1 Tax=Amycolatopsis magusensis TaxID=882444 RepID=UPI0024A96007|nr:helix-turn-helix transcriptional regulator [Amycolatopsis magusensis]MDI5977601.1 helix-turn-helix transcriptional regulator [Amycolatopsis magusensis]UJW31860.1 helix-turn-helix transcriptional regulator [Saccharothrix sp. AJ9571]
MLRQERDSKGYTQRDVAEALDWSPSKLIRIEKGTVGISVTDLKALLLHYDITERERVDQLVDMVKAGKKPAWWHQYRDVYPQQFINFIGLESSAIRIRQFQGLIVPGTLQTPEYAASIMRAYGTVEANVERGVEVRMRRREELIRSGGPELSFIIDESALLRQVGDSEVMVGQVRQLMELSAYKQMHIQVMPFSAGPSSAMVGSFIVLELSEEQDDYAMMLETPDGAVLVDEPNEQTARYSKFFTELRDKALSEDDTQVFLDELLGRLGEDG